MIIAAIPMEGAAIIIPRDTAGSPLTTLRYQFSHFLVGKNRVYKQIFLISLSAFHIFL